MKAQIFTLYFHEGGKKDQFLNCSEIEAYDKDKNPIEETRFSLKNLTEKGYASQKKFYDTFEVIEWIDDDCAIITEESYNSLKSKYSKKAKIFQTARQRAESEAAMSMTQLASMIDIHDIG